MDLGNNKKNNNVEIPNLSSAFIAFSPSFNRERDYFVENIAILLTSGLDILSILDAMGSEFKSKGMKMVIAYIREKIDDGSQLWAILEPLHLVPDYVISLVKIGEETGKLPENFKVIVQQRKKESSLNNKIQSAMSYPLLVLVLAIIILLGITWFILPSLSGVYGRLGIELPLLTVILIQLGDFMAKYGFIVAPGILLILFTVIYVLFFSPQTKYLGQILLFKTPLIDRYVREIELSRFGFYMGTLLGAGVPVTDSLASLVGLGGLYPYLKFYSYLHEKIVEGYTFDRCFKEFPHIDKYIPPVTENMIVNGEKSGHLPEVFQSIGEIYEAKTDSATKNLASILEPALLIVVWFAVAGIALGIVLPIYGLIGNIGDISSGNNINNSEQNVILVTAAPTPTKSVTPTEIIPISSPEPTPTEIVSNPDLTVSNPPGGFVNVRDKP